MWGAVPRAIVGEKHVHLANADELDFDASRQFAARVAYFGSVASAISSLWLTPLIRVPPCASMIGLGSIIPPFLCGARAGQP
jgi:hypothetical protein